MVSFMKKLAVLFMSASMFASTAYADVVATYAGGDITDSQVMEKFKPMIDMQPEYKGKSFSQLDKQLREMLVRNYISARLIEDEAVKQKIRENKEFKERFAMVEQQMVHQFVIEKYLEKNVTDKMVEDEYNKIVAEMKGQKEIKTSHILIDTEEKAKEIKKKLDSGEKFEDLAKKHSKDETSAVRGGEIGYTIRGQLVPEYETVAFALPKNKISEPVKSKFGWHIIRLDDKRDAKLPSKEEAMAGIRQKLSAEKLGAYFESLEKKANVDYK